MIKSKWVTHVILECVTCKKEWSNHKTAVGLARRHVAKTEHTVRGEIGYAVEMKGKP